MTTSWQLLTVAAIQNYTVQKALFLTEKILLNKHCVAFGIF